jgi:hypothetical protein
MTKCYESPVFPIKIDYTSAAEKILEERGFARITTGLSVLMHNIGADYAYLGASGGSLRVHLTWPPMRKTPERRP